MATRGCTSSAASSEAQVLRVPCTVIRGTRAAVMHRSKLRLKVARLDRRAVPGGEDQAGVDPAISRTVTVSVLLLLADLERGDAQVRQRQRCLGCLSLDLAADELVPDALELLADVQLWLVTVHVNLVPSQAEGLALA